ncbi:HpcH/HpaI aldolase family protein [Microbacterium sp. RD1]|uniref:HpcH/HpaI aldolase family protein n=1 Tax=Microbacterium sp. RD1 TaxID=3457313 RepID=UPI003FA5EA47
MTTPPADPRRRSLFRAALQRTSGPAIGTWVKLPAVESVELAALAGFDFVVIDLEHSPLDLQTMYAQIGVARLSGVAPIVRIPAADAGLIQRVLDAGAEGIMVPHVDTADQAARVVRMMRFPPVGTRGVGGTSRAGAWGALPREEYVRFGQEEVVLIAQLESAEAVRNAGEIAATEGVDTVLVGAADLAMSEGLADGDPRVTELIREAVARIAPTGTPVGNAGGATADAVRSAVALGFTFTMMSNDASLLGAAARAAVTAGRTVGFDDEH